ncbi:MAG TPA: cell division protein FtsZ [Thermohalobaculum sp.]|nr:cell division protein FtsZ [Thermohalobaculum sp.]
MVLNLRQPEDNELRARITVFGVGGAGGNAVNNMIEKKLQGVEFIVANTDAQALAHSRAPRKIQLGTGVTRGLGAGSKPDVGLSAAEESIEEVMNHLEGCHMCFITAGMGGGTGTGAAPVVARCAREMGILTVGVVTKPFQFEGARRMQLAEMGVAELQSVVDTLIVIPNQNLFQVASERTTFVEAFMMADDVLYQGVQGVTDLMVRPGMINLDFADVRSVMEEMGKAMMGTGEADGDTRAVDAAEKAIANPLLDEVSLKGAKGVLINITGGYDLTLFEVDEAANRIKEEVDPDAMIKFGSAIDPEMEGRMRVSVVATGIDAENAVERPPLESVARRRPQATDPGMISALRGAQRRAELSQPESSQFDAVEAVEDGSADERIDPPVREPAAESANEPVAEPANEPIAGERRPAVARAAPTPSDIRARAEEVRQRAMAARAQRVAERTGPVSPVSAVVGDEPGLFDIDGGSVEPGPLRADSSARPRAEESGTREARTAEPAAATRATATRAPATRAPSAEPRPPSGRSGLFAINRLIHRVAGGPAADAGSAVHAEARPDSMDEDDGEIPAFLRRQAN